jgi:hypothetical protein
VGELLEISFMKKLLFQQNSAGFRDVERPVASLPGVYRIMCVGDSYTWGWGVEQEQIYTHLLGRWLCDAGQKVEVI